MIQTDGIIFDMDGTLWDASEGIWASWVECLEQLKEPYDFGQKDVERCFGMPMDQIFARLFPHKTREEQLRLAHEVLNHENEYLAKSGGRLYPRLEEVLSRLQQRFKLYIVSNCQSGYIEAFFEAHGTAHYFEDIECYGNTALYKAENIRLLVERNGLKAPVYVGDVQGDADAAHAAGVPIIYAAYGFGTVRDAEETIETFADIEDIVQELP